MQRSLVSLAAGLAVALAAAQAAALDRAELKVKGEQAIAILQDEGLTAGAEYLADPANGLVDLQGTGLHIWSVTRAGIVNFDVSGQLLPGMDISGLADTRGSGVVADVVAAPETNGGYLAYANDWPHPTTNAIGPSLLWCGAMDAQSMVCAQAWIDG